MVTASLRAQIADLLGHDAGDEDRAARPTVAEAVARCVPGAVIPARDGERELAVIGLADGRIYCMADRCPHDGGPLSDGFVEDDQIVCARHGRTFDPTAPACSTQGGNLVDARLLRPGSR